MRRTLLTATMSLFLGLAPAVLLINPASAQSSGGAQHFEYISCNTEGVCFTVDTLINTTVNKSVSSVIVRTDITGVNNVEGCTVDTSVSNDSYNLFKFDTGLQAQTYNFDSTALIACAGQPAQICTFSQTLVYANGEYRYEPDDESTCTPA